ncbi:formyltetrahydrofolate deformylase [Lentzea sp. NPDC102401]|uniref:formyltetrahydrofolate deformylase n=1 Tax=Lentzea sp. NPDC102401 TaxID=3364128 RepID=UPI003827EBB6
MTGRHVLTVAAPSNTLIGLVRTVTNTDALGGPEVEIETQVRGSSGFLRGEFAAGPGALAALERDLGAFSAEHRAARWTVHRHDQRPRILVLCSQQGHVLTHLLSRHEDGVLGGEIAAVLSNHDRHAAKVRAHGLKSVHIGWWAQDKHAAERELLALVHEHQADLVVLARFMQVLSGSLCDELAGRMINVHHSLLPAFVGGRAYHQAHERGVRVVGATAHFVTAGVDEGPILVQKSVPVERGQVSPGLLAEAGRDAEMLAMAEAIRLLCAGRVIPHGQHPVIF